MTGSHPQTVVVHPLVLLSVVDHYNRVAKVISFSFYFFLKKLSFGKNIMFLKK